MHTPSKPSSPPFPLCSTLASAAGIKPTGDTLATANVNVEIPFLIRGTLREYQHVVRITFWGGESFITYNSHHKS